MPTQNGEALSMYIGVGVADVVVLLIYSYYTALIVISDTVCLQKRRSERVNTLTDNVVYGVTQIT